MQLNRRKPFPWPCYVSCCALWKEFGFVQWVCYLAYSWKYLVSSVPVAMSVISSHTWKHLGPWRPVSLTPESPTTWTRFYSLHTAYFRVMFCEKKHFVTERDDHANTVSTERLKVAFLDSDCRTGNSFKKITCFSTWYCQVPWKWQREHLIEILPPINHHPFWLTDL